MIKAFVAKPDKSNPMMVLGLTHENLQRLKAGEPIFFETGDLGWEIRACPRDSKNKGSVLLAAAESYGDLTEAMGLGRYPDPKPGEEKRVFFEAGRQIHRRTGKQFCRHVYQNEVCTKCKQPRGEA